MANSKDRALEENLSPKKKGKGSAAEDSKLDASGGAGKPKKKKKGKALRIIIILLLLAAIATIALWYLRIIPDPTGFWARKSLDEYQTQLDQQQTELDQKQAELDQREVDLNARETSISAQESTATGTTSASSDNFETILGKLSTEKITELQKLASIYTKMDAAAAASIMTGMYSNQDIALIIYYMKADAAALVLANMSTTLAATITAMVAE